MGSAIAGTCLVAAPAFAQSASPPPAAPEESRAVAPGDSFDDVRYQDANADRAILGSTAETHPAGTFFFSDYELVLAQFGYALDDSVQVAASIVPPLTTAGGYLVDLGVKANLVRTAGFRFALTGALDTIGNSTFDRGADNIYVGRVGAVGQFCFDAHCLSSLSIDVGGGGTRSGQEGFFPLYGSVSLVAKLSTRMSLVVEPSIGDLVATRPMDDEGVVSVGYGFRYSTPRVGVDLTLVAPLASVSNENAGTLFLPGYPFVAFTYRTEGTVHVPLHEP
jgi:hypothetical protein